MKASSRALLVMMGVVAMVVTVVWLVPLRDGVSITVMGYDVTTWALAAAGVLIGITASFAVQKGLLDR